MFNVDFEARITDGVLYQPWADAWTNVWYLIPRTVTNILNPTSELRRRRQGFSVPVFDLDNVASLTDSEAILVSYV